MSSTECKPLLEPGRTVNTSKIKSWDEQSLEERAITSDIEEIVEGTFSESLRLYGTRLYYASYVLILLLLANTSDQLSKQVISYIKDPMMEDIEFNESQYGLLLGYAFSILYVVCGIPFGFFADKYSRKYLVIFGIVIWSAMTIWQAAAKTYAELVIARMGLGVGEAAFNPAALAIIADYFPPENRAIANSIYSLGIFFGGGLSSALGGTLGDLESFGWRWTLGTFAIFGFGVAIFILITLLEPTRGRYSKILITRTTRALRYDYIETVKYMLNLDSVWVFYTAASIRMLATITFGGFMPPFFKREFPNYPSEVNWSYGVIVFVGGILASFIGGVVTKVWNRKSVNAPLYVMALGSLLSCPFVAGMVYARVLFENELTALIFALICLFCAYLTAEVWGGPSFFVLQSIFPAKMQGSGFALYFSNMYLIGGAGPVLVGFLLDFYCPDHSCGPLHTPIERQVIAGTIIGSYLISGFMFWATRFVYSSDLQWNFAIESGEQKVKEVTIKKKILGIIYGLFVICLAVSFVTLSFL